MKSFNILIIKEESSKIKQMRKASVNLKKQDQELIEMYSDVMSRMILNDVKGMEDNTDGPFS